MIKFYINLFSPLWQIPIGVALAFNDFYYAFSWGWISRNACNRETVYPAWFFSKCFGKLGSYRGYITRLADFTGNRTWIATAIATGTEGRLYRLTLTVPLDIEWLGLSVGQNGSAKYELAEGKLSGPYHQFSSRRPGWIPVPHGHQFVIGKGLNDNVLNELGQSDPTRVQAAVDNLILWNTEMVKIKFAGCGNGEISHPHMGYWLKLGPIGSTEDEGKSFKAGNVIEVLLKPNEHPGHSDLTFEDGTFAIEVPNEFFTIVSGDVEATPLPPTESGDADIEPATIAQAEDAIKVADVAVKATIQVDELDNIILPCDWP